MMDWLTTLGIKKHPVEIEEEETEDLTFSKENLYKHRWVWYHLILCIQMILTNVLLIAILVTIAIKL